MDVVVDKEASTLGAQTVIQRPIEGVTSRSGTTRTGMPLSLNRAAAPDLDPWIGRIVVARVETSPNFEAHCGLCNDIAFQRILLGGEWLAETADGKRRFGAEPILLGPHSQYMPVTCSGPMSTLGIGFRPGALRKLLGRDMSSLVNRIEPGDPFGILQNGGGALFAKDASVEDWADLLEDAMRAFIQRTQPEPPDRLSTAFDYASFANPNIAPSLFAQQQGVSLRTVERTVRRDFGMPPRMVLRRARVLDLAAQLLGVADENDENDFIMRYFDQSHVIREFQTFFGCTPRAFRAEPRILLTINLETRAARRLEELNRIAPGATRPWQCEAVA